jgi:hypothetical protein
MTTLCYSQKKEQRQQPQTKQRGPLSINNNVLDKRPTLEISCNNYDKYIINHISS